jgi:uncharacterized membrane protein
VTLAHPITGALIGAVLAAWLGPGDAILPGLVIGAVLGHLARRMKATPQSDARIAALEARVAQLGDAVEQLRERLRTAERGSVAPAAADATASVAASTEVSTPTPAIVSPLQDTVATAPIVEPPPASPAADLPDTLPADVEPPLSDAWGAPPTQTPAWIAATLGWFTGGNTIVRVGIVVLFFGVAFLLKFAYDHSNVPPELRIGGATLAGMVLTALGWRLRERRAGFAVALQGGGIGIMYLAVFAALRLYALLPAGFAFGLLATIAASAAILALRQQARSLAVLGTAGGFLAPVLASTGSGDHVALFGYYAVLNAGIVAIAARRPWRVLNLTGFAFTFAIGAAWGARFYRPDLWPTTQPFLAAFFLAYLAIQTFFARQAVDRGERALDGTLVFGLPLAAFAMQVRLVAHFEYGAALSTLAISAIYVAAAQHVRRRQDATEPLLVPSFAALALLFATLTIPLALDAGWTSAAWALEGAALVWIGLRQSRVLPRMAGYVLQFGAAVAFLDGFPRAAAAIPIANRDCLGFVFLALAAGFTALQLRRRADRVSTIESHLRPVAFVAAFGWWLAGGLHELDTRLANDWQTTGALAFFAATCAAFEAMRTRLDWPAAGRAAFALLPLAFAGLLVQMIEQPHPFARSGFLAWAAIFGVHLWMLRRREAAITRAVPWLHAAGVWLLALVAGWELAWAAGRATGDTTDWPFAAAGVPATVLVAWLATGGPRLAWPVAAHLRAYLLPGAGPVIVGMLLWLVACAIEARGDATPLPFVPILNPVDLASGGALLAVALWLRALSPHGLDAFLAGRPWLRHGIPGAVAFIVANGALLRALHQFAGVPLDFDGIADSRLAQAAISLFWTVLATAAMIVAHRLGRRTLWITGATLLGVTVLKLLLDAIASHGGLEQSIACLGAGALMLATGWFAPVPPKRPEESA